MGQENEGTSATCKSGIRKSISSGDMTNAPDTEVALIIQARRSIKHATI